MIPFDNNNKKPLFAVSLMCMDFLNCKEQIEIMNNHFDILHADIMDGHYCKNMALSPDFIKSISKTAKIPIDVHMMVTAPNDFIDVIAAAGASIISVHAETINTDAFRTIDRIRSHNCKVGIVLNPATPLSYISEYIDMIDMLTIMTIDVGFAGQKFIPRTLDKIKDAVKLREENNYKYVIQIDGRGNSDTYKQLYEAGTECFIVGTSGVFALDENFDVACKKMKESFNLATGANI